MLYKSSYEQNLTIITLGHNHIITMFQIIVLINGASLILLAPVTANAIGRPQILKEFNDLLEATKHCTFISIRSNQPSTCEIMHKESFCNEFLQTVQEQYKSPLVSYVASSSFSLLDMRISPLPAAKLWHSRCTAWIQCNIVFIPPALTNFEPAIFIFYSNLDNFTYNFNDFEFTTKAAWLQAIESFFSKPMVIIHANPNSKAI